MMRSRLDGEAGVELTSVMGAGAGSEAGGGGGEGVGEGGFTFCTNAFISAMVNHAEAIVGRWGVNAGGQWVRRTRGPVCSTTKVVPHRPQSIWSGWPGARCTLNGEAWQTGHLAWVAHSSGICGRGRRSVIGHPLAYPIRYEIVSSGGISFSS